MSFTKREKLKSFLIIIHNKYNLTSSVYISKAVKSKFEFQSKSRKQ